MMAFAWRSIDAVEMLYLIVVGSGISKLSSFDVVALSAAAFAALRSLPFKRVFGFEFSTFCTYGVGFAASCGAERFRSFTSGL